MVARTSRNRPRAEDLTAEIERVGGDQIRRWRVEALPPGDAPGRHAVVVPVYEARPGEYVLPIKPRDADIVRRYRFHIASEVPIDSLDDLIVPSLFNAGVRVESTLWRGQLTRVGDLVTCDGPNVGRGNGGDGGCPAIECRKLDLERPAIAVDMYYGTYVARLEAVASHGREQHHSIMCFDHVDDSLPAWVGRDQPGRHAAGLDNPHRTHGPAMHASVRHQPALNNMFLAVHGMG